MRSLVSRRSTNPLATALEGIAAIGTSQENPELEKHLISVAPIPLIEKAIRLGLTESEFLDECREIWDIQTHPEKYRV